jgi:Erv1 / Alr family
MAMSLPEHFGRHWWETIHTAAASATTSEKRKEYRRFVIVTVPTLLPCEACSKHWQQVLRRYPIEQYMGSEEQLLLWSYLAHGDVNDVLGKDKQPSYHEVKHKYLPEPGKVVCTTVCSLDGGDGGEAGEHAPSVSKRRLAGRQPLFSYRR